MQQTNPDPYKDGKLSESADAANERQLLQQFVEKQDQVAFEALMKLHGRLVYGVCRRVLGKFHDAEDAFQATFLIFARKAGSIRQSEHLSHWLYQVARRTALKAKFAAAKRLQYEKPEMPSNSQFADVRSTDLWPEVEPWLDQELSNLPEIYRLTIIACDLEGRTHKEAAKHLEMPEGTFSARLVKAREMLGQRLMRRGIVLPAGALAVLVSQNAASAAVPPALYTSTATAVSTYTATGTIPTSIVSNNAAMLAKASWLATLTTKTVLATVMAVSIVVGGAGFMMIADAKPVAAISTIDAERELVALGAKVVRYNDDPQQAVIDISFHPNNQFADQHVHLLKSFAKLKWLSLKGTKITDASFDELGTLTQLSRLDVSNTEITGATFDKLNGIKFLVHLVLNSTKITDGSLKNLQGLPHLMGLYIKSCDISNEGLNILKDLPISKEIEALGLESTKITDSGLEYLRDFKQLKQLLVSGTQITDAGTKPLEKLTRLTKLEVKQTAVSAESVKQLQAILPNLNSATGSTFQMNGTSAGMAPRNSANRLATIGLIFGNLVLGGIGLYFVRKRRKAF